MACQVYQCTDYVPSVKCLWAGVAGLNLKLSKQMALKCTQTRLLVYLNKKKNSVICILSYWFLVLNALSKPRVSGESNLEIKAGKGENKMHKKDVSARFLCFH